MITVRCTRPDCVPIYQSSPIKGEHHRRNAEAKALRLAQEHAVATGHEVEVHQDGRVGVVACRCARCKAETPGNATGVCGDCAKAVLDSLLKEEL